MRPVLEGVAGEVLACLKAARRPEDVLGAEVEHRLGVRMVAAGGRIAGHADDVLDPKRMCREHVGLDRQPVAVAPRDLQGRLDAPVAQQVRHCEGRHGHAGGGGVGQVEGRNVLPQ